MRTQFFKDRFALISRDDGWVLMDAVWSSVVVIMAFMATFMALESGNNVAARDVSRTTAYDVAQDEMAALRDLGKTSLIQLLAKNNTNVLPASPSKTVTINGRDYQVWLSAYYVTGLGNNAYDACGGTYGSNGNGTAKFVYMKVRVTYPHQPVGTPPATLDEYFSPEGGDTNAATGTLRVYLLNRNNSPYVNTSVRLAATGIGMTFTPQTATTGTSGCVLFTGLPRGEYNIEVTTNRYDLYLNNPTATLLNVPIRVPDRAAMSKDIRMESPIKVPVSFATTLENGTELAVTPSLPANTTTGPNLLVGPWVGRSSQIIQASGTDFTPLPGTIFMNHTWLPSYAQTYMYPDPGGYDVFPGPCNVNAPPALEHVPDSVGNLTWGPGLTYQENAANMKFVLPQLRTRIYIGDRTDGLLLKDKAIRPSGTFPNFGARQLVKLIGEANAPTAATQANCGPLPGLFNTWQRMRGTFKSPVLTAVPNTPTEYLTDDAEVLPRGKYQVCLSAYVTGTKRASILSSWSGLAETRYKLLTVDLDSSKTINWDPMVDIGDNVNGVPTPCAVGATWTP